ncbi:MAG: hypothetical protein QNI95_08180 [Desulfobacterales bacterium]|nr:hypothetical protein [Desulfobacterales bacterium]
MITRKEQQTAQEHAAEMLKQAGITITEKEAARIEVADFGLGHLEKEGAQALTLVQTDRISVKVLVLFPLQTLPEHWHPPVGTDPGKEETLRVISGRVFFYIEGQNSLKEGFIVEGKEDCYTLRHEIIMQPADQILLAPGEKHWLQAGDQGAVLYSFSTIARDALDQFTDPHIDRITKIMDE